MSEALISKQKKTSESQQPALSQSFYQPLQCQLPSSQIIVIQKQNYQDIRMLQGEQLKVTDSFRIFDPETKKDTQLYLTNYRIIIPRAQLKSIPYGYIHSLVANDKCLRVNMKTGLFYDIFTQHNIKDLETYITMYISDLPFCVNTTSQIQGDITYDSWAEIDRMTVDRDLFNMAKNTRGSICPTYPLYFLIPSGYQIETLQEVQKCRHKDRFPVMSYYYAQTSCGIWRSAKKRTQLTKQRQMFNKSYLNSISIDLQVINLDEKSANVNKWTIQSLPALKKNFENVAIKYYKTTMSYPPEKSDELLKALGQWFQEISKLISLAYYVVDLLNKGRHVLLEQTYGYDRVPQVLSLAEIIIDPFYRTFKGFSILVQKQFVSFGYPFHLRCGFNRNHPEESSPVFIQFLQCLHQLIVAHPQCFQYSPGYLARIGYEVYTTKYKNFIQQHHNDKINEKLKNCSKDIWDKINRQRCHKNYQFKQGIRNQLCQIRPKPSVKQYTIWVSYFDMICKMNGQIKIKGEPLEQSQRISVHLEKGKK